MVVDNVPLSPRGGSPRSPRSCTEEGSGAWAGQEDQGQGRMRTVINKNLEPLVQGLVRLHGRMHHDFPGGWGSHAA